MESKRRRRRREAMCRFKQLGVPNSRTRRGARLREPELQARVRGRRPEVSTICQAIAQFVYSGARRAELAEPFHSGSVAPVLLRQDLSSANPYDYDVDTNCIAMGGCRRWTVPRRSWRPCSTTARSTWPPSQPTLAAAQCSCTARRACRAQRRWWRRSSCAQTAA